MDRRFFARLPIVIGLAAGLAYSTFHSSATASRAAAARDNGRSIFLTGKNLDGVQIVAQKPPLLRSCAACHRANGSGGLHLPGGAVSADLRHAALVTGQKRPYTMKLLERAITSGIDNEGKPLSSVMPHWRLSHQDLQAVAAYVLTKLK